MYVYTQIFIYNTNMCICTRTHVNMHRYVHVCVYPSMQACMYACMHACLYAQKKLVV